VEACHLVITLVGRRAQRFNRKTIARGEGAPREHNITLVCSDVCVVMYKMTDTYILL
jgi:hypothetical protein